MNIATALEAAGYTPTSTRETANGQHITIELVGGKYVEGTMKLNGRDAFMLNGKNYRHAAIQNAWTRPTN